MTDAELFVCAPLDGVRLMRAACGKRYERATLVHAGVAGRLSIEASGEPGWARCNACPIGAAHVRGERPATWPDGSPVVTLRVAVAAASGPAADPLKRPAPRRRKRPAQLKRASRDVPTYEWAGEARTARGWSLDPRVVALGLSYATVFSRLKTGWDVGSALTTPPLRNTRRGRP